MGAEAEVLFLHPVAMDHRSADWLTLPPAIIPDLPGHGGRAAPRPGLTLDDIADEAAGWVRRPVHVIGALWGGTVALHLALNHPGLVKSLFLAGSDPGAQQSARTERARQIEAGDRMVQQTLERWFGAEALQAPPSAPIAYARRCLETTPLDSLAAAWRTMASHDVTTRLGEITAPTTVLAGAYDAVHSVADQVAFCESLPHSRLIQIPAHHMSLLDNPAAFSAAFRQHLAWASRPAPRAQP
ncbi:MAG: alpha/beta hydrolase [Bifidobacteriaceae bacterium]|jgi:3-oxoadipate enol-lactonase|nr:alpha/beta hydrolase [Bifidobacteriaceae bacterium]